MTDQELVSAVTRVEGQISPREALLLYTLAKRATRGAIVEVGSYRGRSTVALALGSREGAQAPVYAVDPHAPFVGALGGVFGPHDRVQFLQNVLAAGVAEVVHPVALPSTVASRAWSGPIAVLFLDGDHTLDAVARDVEAWLPHVPPGGIVVFHDSRDPALGPVQVVSQLVASGAWQSVGVVDTATVLQRAG